MINRDTLQENFGNILQSTNFCSAIIAQRVGKCRIILKHVIKESDKVLICYPDLPIQQSWVDEFNKLGFTPTNIKFSTYLSIKKIDEKFDFIILDEAHRISNAQLVHVQRLMKMCKALKAITGTMNANTRDILQAIGLPVIIDYPLDCAVKDGIISDYEIHIHEVDLHKTLTAKYNKQSYYIEYLKACKNWLALKIAAINRMRTIHSNPNKFIKCNELISKGGRTLVFAHETKYLDLLNIPQYHSKNKDEKLKNEFCNGEGNVMGVCQMLAMGVTIKPLDRIIILGVNSNSEKLSQQIARAVLIDYVGKIARIDIIVTRDTQETIWLTSALQIFNQKNIIWEK